MILHRVKCEMCESQFEINPLMRPHEWNFPDNRWFTVLQGNIANQEAYHFCNKDCLQQWLEEKS